jgi:hypothetical protein
MLNGNINREPKYIQKKNLNLLALNKEMPHAIKNKIANVLCIIPYFSTEKAVSKTSRADESLQPFTVIK